MMEYKLTVSSGLLNCRLKRQASNWSLVDLVYYILEVELTQLKNFCK